MLMYLKPSSVSTLSQQISRRGSFMAEIYPQNKELVLFFLPLFFYGRAV